MKKIWKQGLTAVMALALALTVSACGGGVTSFDATKYIQGLMDETYLGVFDPEYMKIVEIDEAEAQATYENNLSVESEYFASFFDINNLTDEIKADIMELYKEIYAKSKYTVNTATKIDDKTYGIKVQVEPLDIMHLVYADMGAYMEDFYSTYTQEMVDAMTDEEYDAYDAEWAALLIALCREKLPEAGYLEEKSMVVQMAKDSNDVWSITDDDFGNLDSYIIDYNVY